jgi:hypothetical protein
VPRLGVHEPQRCAWLSTQRMDVGTGWVLDYVVVHELAHLVVPGHGPEFAALVARYPKAERAIGYLIARGHMDDDDGAGGPG